MTLTLPLDHLVVLVSDLEAAGAAFQAAGFVTTAQTLHAPHLGTANICVMFADHYIELMGIHAPTPANAGWRALLAMGQGLRGIALRSNDIAATQHGLEAAQLAHDPVRAISRVTPEAELRFSVIRMARSATPGLQCLWCQHHTRQAMFGSHPPRHPNGARRVVSVSWPDADSLIPLRAGADALGAGEIQITAGPAQVVIAVAQSGQDRAVTDALLMQLRQATGLTIQLKAV